MSDDHLVDHLVDVLGGSANITRDRAQRLLDSTGGNIELAISQYLSSAEPQAAAGGSGGHGPSAVAQMRAVLGSTPPDQQLVNLLSMCRGNVEAAVDMYLDDPSAGLPPRLGGGPAANGNRGARDSDDDVVMLSSDSSDEAEADAGGPPAAVARSRGGRVAAPPRGAAAPGCAGPGSGRGGPAGGAAAAPRGGPAAAPPAAAQPPPARAPRQPPAAARPAGGAAANPAGGRNAGGPSGAAGGSSAGAGVPPQQPAARQPATAEPLQGNSNPNPGPEPGRTAPGGGPAGQPPPHGLPPLGQGGRGPGPRPGPGPQPAVGAGAGRVAQVGSAEQPALRPLLNGDLLADAKRRQGPFPVAPELPLPAMRRPDGTLHCTDHDAVPPGRVEVPAASYLYASPSAMDLPRLGEVTAPLELDLPLLRGGRTSCVLGGSQEVPQEMQGELLQLAISWLAEGKLSGCAGQQGSSFKAPSRDFLWQLEWVEAMVEDVPAGGGAAVAENGAGPSGSGGGRRAAADGAAAGGAAPVRRIIPRGYRLALYVANKDFIGAAAAKFPDVKPLKDLQERARWFSGSGYWTGDSRPALRIAATRPGGPLERLLRVLQKMDAGLDILNAGWYLGRQDPLPPVNVRLLGPGLPPAVGVALKLDSRDDAARPPQDGNGGKEDSSQGGKGKGKQGKGRKSVEGAGKQGAGASPNGKGSKAAAGMKRKVAEAAGEEGGEGKGGAAKRRKGAAGGVVVGAASGDAKEAEDGEEARGFRVQIEFFLDRKLLEACPPSKHYPEEVAANGLKRGRAPGYRKDSAELLATVIHTLLEHGTGLLVGPDCDGALNTGDTHTLPQAAAGRAGAGDPEGGPGRRGRSRSASAGPSTAAAAAAAASDSDSDGAAADGAVPGGGDDEEDLRSLDVLLDSVVPPEDFPQAAVPGAVVAHPKPFQLQGLEWMLRRERQGDALGRSLLLLHPAWAQVVLADRGKVLHVHRLAPSYITTDFFPAPVGGTCGGFLCDEMGLGKSLQTLMLIKANPPPPNWTHKPVPLPAPHGGGPRLSALPELPDREPAAIKTTLLVTPANLQEQWVGEMERHLARGSLKWAIFHGARDSQGWEAAAQAAAASAAEDDGGGGGGGATRRSKRGGPRQPAAAAAVAAGAAKGVDLLPPVLAVGEDGQTVPVHECDVVLVSYEVLRRELSNCVGSSSSARLAARQLPLLGFWRIVLDEAQLVANSNSVAAQVVSSLYRRHAWVVTGTPISSSLGELAGLCEFLAYHPYCDASVWKHLVHAPYSSHHAMGVTALRTLLRGVMLRRSKAAVEAQLALPPCERIDRPVQLSGVERTFYDVLKARYMSALAAVKAGGGEDAARGGAGGGPGGGGGRGGRGGGRGGAGRGGGLGRGGAGQAAPEDVKKTHSNYHRATTALVELRQCCCHPHIVRKEAVGPGGRGGGGGKAAGERLSMRQIMAKLVAEAYAVYDQTVAALYGTKLLQAGLADLDTPVPIAAEAIPGQDAAAAAAAASSAAVAGSGGGRVSAVLALLQDVRRVRDIVSGTEEVAQARLRGAQGAVDWGRVPPEMLEAAARLAAEVEAARAAKAAEAAEAGAGKVVEGKEEGAEAEGGAGSSGAAGGSAGPAGAEGGGAGPASAGGAAADGQGQQGEGQAQGQALVDKLLEDAARRKAEEAARERRRRWQKLELDCLLLRVYVACLQAPLGTLQLLSHTAAARARAREEAEARERAARTRETADHRARVHAQELEQYQREQQEAEAAEDAAAVAVAEAAVAGAGQLPRENGVAGAGGSAAAAPGGAASPGADSSAAGTANGEAEKEADEAKRGKKRAKGGKAKGGAKGGKAGAKGQDGGTELSEEEEKKLEEEKKKKERLARLAKSVSDAEDAATAAATAAEVAAEMAAAAVVAEREALDKAAPEVAAAAAAVQMLVDEMNALREQLGMEPLDLTTSEGELRRSGRERERERGAEAAVAAADGDAQPGPSAPARAIPRGGRRARTPDTDSGSDQSGGSSDSGSEDSDDSRGGRRGGRARKRARGGPHLAPGSPSGLVGGMRLGAQGKAAGTAAGAAADADAELMALGASAHQAALFRSETVIKSFQATQGRRVKAAATAAGAKAAAKAAAKRAAAVVDAELARLAAAASEKWHNVQHLAHRQEDLGLAPNGPGAEAGPSGSGQKAAAAAAAPDGAASAEDDGKGKEPAARPPPLPPWQAAGPAAAVVAAAIASAAAAAGGSGADEDGFQCPICLDNPLRRSVTKCGHAFCSDCIHNIVEEKGSGSCPICRATLRKGDIFDGATDEEAAAAEAMALAGANSEYGAKVSAMLSELASMSAEDPGSKALVFSSWGRLLRLVQDALAANGVRCASLVGGNLEARQAALHSFLHDPDCRVLLLLKSTTGGAAGLTLTVAHTAFVLEPAVNPGLEAQAAARICRLGQDRPTRVIRLIAENTVEERVLALQRHKLQHGSAPAPVAAAAGAGGGGGGGGAAEEGVATEAVDRRVLLAFFDNL